MNKRSILITKENNKYYARVEGTKLFGCGNSEREALGDLFYTRAPEMDIILLVDHASIEGTEEA